MKRTFHLLAIAGLVIGATITGLPAMASSTPTAAAATPADDVQSACPTPKPGQVQCFAEILTGVHGVRGPLTANTPPPGYGPADLRSAYNLPATGGANQTVAIVDAGDDVNAEADLAVYRKTYGLPACTTANGCFHKVNQTGGASPLPADEGWATASPRAVPASPMPRLTRILAWLSPRAAVTAGSRFRVFPRPTVR